jgi:7-keto-8-aminopelargonate synthetase-like enzyme
MILLNSSIGNYVISNGKKFSYFGGNNYLGLASHPAVKEAAIKAIEKYGVNFSASRRTSGTADIHLELEKQLADFKGKEDTVVFASGYQGNSILLEVLNDRYSEIFIDRFAHASIISAVKGERAHIHYYNHCNAEHLERLLENFKGESPLIITDGIFALTGEIAPLDKIFPLVKKYNAILMVDDAHSTGILGKTGKGTPEHFKLSEDDNIYQSETMSKALGGYGGFISGRRRLADLIREKSTTYQSSTALPPPVVAAGIASLKVINENPQLRENLFNQANLIRREVINLDFETTRDETPIIPIIFSEIDKARKLSAFLEENRIIVPFMNYPSAHETYMIRIAVSAVHTDDQANELVGLLKKWKANN